MSIAANDRDFDLQRRRPKGNLLQPTVQVRDVVVSRQDNASLSNGSPRTASRNRSIYVFDLGHDGLAICITA
jgi:hypothetical protein